MQKEEAMASVNVREQVFKKERERELDDLDLRSEKEMHEQLNNVPVQQGERISLFASLHRA